MKKYLHIATSLLLLASCSKENPVADTGTAGQHDIMVTVGAKAISADNTDDHESRIDRITAYCFSQKPGEDQYTFETIFYTDFTETGLPAVRMNISLVGSIPRILYFATCAPDEVDLTIPFLNMTSGEFERDAYFSGETPAPQSPFCLVAKQECPAPSSINTMSVELAHVVARIDINNQKPLFTIDSMVLNNAPSGSHIFNEKAAKSTYATVNYGNANKIYLYQTGNTALSVYGKYDGIRTAFDVQLKDIKAGTRYRLTLKSAGDSSLSQTDVLWSVNDWNTGEEIDSSPDWQ